MGQFGKTRGEMMAEAALWHIDHPWLSAFVRLLFAGAKVALLSACATLAVWGVWSLVT